MIRKFNSIIWLTLLMGFVFASNVSAYGDTFSCSYGKRAACLDYGDKVCSSFSKCVSNDAVCFDSYTCNYKGFICKSKFDNLADEYDGLLSKCKNIAAEHDDLVDKYDGLLSKCRNLTAEHDDLVDEYDDLLRKYKKAVSEYEELQSCISDASTLDEAKNCY